MSRKTHLRFFLLRWHRRLGLTAACFVLLLALTGLMLNHSHELGLDQKPLQSPFWHKVYGVPEAPASGEYTIGSHRLHSAGGKLYLDQRVIADCERLLGTAEKAGQFLVVCPRLLVLLTADGEVIDQADGLRGVPEGLSSVSRQGDAVVLHRPGGELAVDLNDLSLRPLLGGGAGAGGGAGEEHALQALPADMQPTAAVAPELTRERLLLDLHSGRILGPWGVWLVDGMAILFAVLAISGLVLFRRHHRR